jgi:formylglycine-generating enzyme required for sulfatase activity
MTPISKWTNRDDAWNDVLTGLSDLIDLQLEAKIKKEQAEAERRRHDPFYDLMIPIKGGTFEMGDTLGGGRSDEKPVHSVTLSDFSLCKYPVTQGLWKAVMGEGNNPSHFKGDDSLPVETVSWEDTQVFIAALNKKSGQQYRLPTEAEWEYAARGGNQSKGYQYSGSNDVKEVAWYDENSKGKTHPVGGLKPNELGLFDMSGNVWEWCQDRFDEKYYEFCTKNGVVVNPVGPDKGVYRVLRGGRYFYGARYCRAAYRSYGEPDDRNSGIGFRLAVQVSG